MDLQNKASFLIVLLTWNAFSEESVAKLVHRSPSVATLLSSELCTRTLAILVAARVKRELQNSADLQPLILDLNFWHQSFLTTIMVDHYPLFEFSCDSACSKIKNVHHDNNNQCVYKS